MLLGAIVTESYDDICLMAGLRNGEVAAGALTLIRGEDSYYWT